MKGGEVIQAMRLASSVVGKVCDVIERDRTLRSAVKRGLNYIWREMRMVICEIESNEEKSQGSTNEYKIVLLKELAYDIEDFIDVIWVPGRSGLLCLACGIDPRTDILQSIDDFKSMIQTVRNWQPDAGSSHGGDDAGSSHGGDGPVPMATGISTCMGKLLSEWLSTAEGEPGYLRVASIVGCRGVGKTALARQIYHHYKTSCEYQFVAWVVASECHDLGDLRTKVLTSEHFRTHQPSPAPADGSTLQIDRTKSLRHILQDKRYMVVVDDVERPEKWLTIKDEFPENGRPNIIIVTTSVHSVAAECSRGRFVHTMRALGDMDSASLFWKVVGEENRSPILERASEGIIKICGGLPLALINVANYLRRQGAAGRHMTGGLTKVQCERTARALGAKILKGQETEFQKINRVLLQCYNDLPDYVHRSCLLYASVFPRGRPINSTILLRKWMAEGLVVANGTITDEECAIDCLEEFIDRSIIEPVQINNARVAKCKLQSIMLEFITHKAASENFMALVKRDEALSNNEAVCKKTSKGNFGVRIRRLSVQDSTNEGVDEAANANCIDLSVLRSLIISESPHLDLHNFKCSLLRVLDLSGCRGRNIVWSVICRQLFLRYLSLQATDIDELPKEILDLKKLETLDIRDTRVEVLPIEVLELKCLAHLLGRFKLPKRIHTETARRCGLKTLAGVIITRADQSFEKIVLHAPKLKKVKIYEPILGPSKKRAKFFHSKCSDRASSSNSSSLSLLKERFTGSKALQFLSIDSNDFSTEFLSFLEAPCAITSIKLRGSLRRLPDTPTLSQLVNLNKLLLISTGLNTEDLSTLQSLYYLEYLTLDEHERGGFSGCSFTVKSGGFPSLKRLCFKAPKLPEVRFEAGSMKSLTILDLLCPGQVTPKCYFTDQYLCWSAKELGVVGVSHIENLNEVILHHCTTESKMQAWQQEAIGHKNRPSVKRQLQPINHAA